MIGTILVCFTSRCSASYHTFAKRCYYVSMFDWTFTATTFINYETSFNGAYTTASFINFVAFFNAAYDANTININARAWWTDTFTIYISDIAFVNSTLYRFWKIDCIKRLKFKQKNVGLSNLFKLTEVTLNGSISLITVDTNTNHCSNWNRIDYLTFGIHSAWLCCITWIDALAVNACRL